MTQPIRVLLALGVVALIGCAAPGTRSGAPEIYYLHLYSTRYDTIVLTRTYGPGEKAEPRNNQRLATIAISPGVEFHAHLPNHYEPEIHIGGTVERRGDTFAGPIRIFVQGVDVAYQYDPTSPVPIDVLVQLDEEPFHFAISTQEDPYALDYEVD